MRISYALGLTLVLGAAAPAESCAAEGYELRSLSMRGRISEQTLLGEDAPEDFKSFDVSASFQLPWARYSDSGWGVGTRLMVSAGTLRGAGETGLVASFIPQLVLGQEGGRFDVDLGIGGALLSRTSYGVQDFGGAFQFALSVGINAPLYQELGVSYRFMHYSDAALHGDDTTGADLHMLEFSYRF